MAENKIKTRLQLKHDTYEHWESVKNTFKPLPGEICIAEIPTGNSAATTAPTVLFKVGAYKTGSTTELCTFGELQWASALAADVYSWAKKTEAEFTAWVAKTPKTVTLRVNNVDTNYTIEEAIKLVRTEITAGGEAAAITIADESTANLIKYVAKQGGTDIVEAIEIGAGTGILIKKSGTNTPTIDHQAKPTTGSAATSAKGSAAATFVTGVKIDALGHVASVDTADVNLSNYKTKQTPVQDPTADGTGTTFIDSITQNANGEITVTKKTVPSVSITDDTSAETPTTATVNVYKNLTANGHVLTEELVQVATAKGVADALQAAKDYADSKPHENTAHTHASGSGIKVSAAGGISGEVVANLNVAFELVNNTIKLYDKDDTSKTAIATLDASEFVKDSYLKNASYDPNTNILTFTFIDNEDNLQAIPVDLTDLVDVYTADEASLTKTGSQFSIKDNGVTTAKIAAKNVTEAKLEQNVQDALALARTAVQDVSDKVDNTITVTGTGYLSGGGALSKNQTIDVSSAVKTKIDNGATAYGWGNHKNAGYLKANGWETANGELYTSNRQVSLTESAGLVLTDSNHQADLNKNGLTVHSDLQYPYACTSYFDGEIRRNLPGEEEEGAPAIVINLPDESGTLALTKDVKPKQTAVSDSYSNGQIVVAVDQDVNGVITSEKKDVAQALSDSSNIQYLIFDCGSATDVI